MQYDFLKAFPKRMKCLGLHAMLQANSSQKSIWRQMGFEGLSEQMNMIFSVLLFIMEQSLKEEICTMDNITAFIDSTNGQYYKKSLGSDDCYALGDFIVNMVLSTKTLALWVLIGGKRLNLLGKEKRIFPNSKPKNYVNILRICRKSIEIVSIIRRRPKKS